MSPWLTPAATILAVAFILWLASRMSTSEESEHDELRERPSKPRSTPASAAEPPSTSVAFETDAAPDSVKSITIEAKSASATGMKPGGAPLPKLDYEEDAEVDPTKVGEATATKKPAPQNAPTRRIVYDADAAPEEQTRPGALILVTATGQTDRGVRRKRNEDNLLALEDESLYVVADGMGGYRGGELASELAVRTIETAFRENRFDGDVHANIPRRASDLARAIQMANEAIFAHASAAKELEGMGTTVCAARFSPNKQRLYIAHVGDSRMYRYRGGAMRQMTTDHTMQEFGVTGAAAAHLSRAVGIWPTVPIDILLAKPVPGDTYLLCSDGLTKMLDDAAIADALADGAAPAEVVQKLIALANERGGKDNITAVVIRVLDPRNPSSTAKPS